MIPYARQSIDQSDIDAVVAVLRSDWLTAGPAIDRFEEMTAAFCGSRFAVSASNATAALHIAMRALDVGPGDWVWTAPNSFLASANCALYCGAQVDFVDIDPRTYNMSAQALRGKLEEAARCGRLPKVVVPVHFAGQPCEMAPIKELAERYGFAIVEDAAHALGATYRDAPIGAGRYADITILSFHPVKIITTGEGGMALTNDAKLAERLRLFRSHGMTRDAALMASAPDGPWYYQQIELGFNYRMTDIHAALGCAQLRRVDDFLARRRALAARYDAALADLDLVTPWQHPDALSAYHLYPIQVPERALVYQALWGRDIRVQVHYIPIHLQPYYRSLGFGPGDFPEAERYYAQALSLPMFADLRESDVDEVAGALREILATIDRRAVTLG